MLPAKFNLLIIFVLASVSSIAFGQNTLPQSSILDMDTQVAVGSNFEIKAMVSSIVGREIIYMDQVDAGIINAIKYLASQATGKCHAKGIEMTSEDLKNDITKCFNTSVAIFANAIATAPDFDSYFFELGLTDLKTTMLSGQPLLPRQKRFLSNSVLAPLCGSATATPVLQECQKPEYTHLNAFKECGTEFEQGLQEFLNVIVQNVCRNIGTWILYFLDADPTKCAGTVDVERTRLTQKLDQCARELQQYYPGAAGAVQAAQVQTKAHLCNATGIIGDCFSNLITFCEVNPKPGQVLFETFSGTKALWGATCQHLSMGPRRQGPVNIDLEASGNPTATPEPEPEVDDGQTTPSIDDTASNSPQPPTPTSMFTTVQLFCVFFVMINGQIIH